MRARQALTATVTQVPAATNATPSKSAKVVRVRDLAGDGYQMRAEGLSVHSPKLCPLEVQRLAGAADSLGPGPSRERRGAGITIGAIARDNRSAD
jgi:hypothetical protein